MKRKVPLNKRTLSGILFAFALSLTLVAAILYAHNIFRWGKQPDIGLYRRMAWDINVVGVVTEPGRKAGVQVGDHVLRVNGKTFANRTELLSSMRWELGEKNTYLLERGGKQFEITITNHPLGLVTSFIKSGLPFLVGLSYILIGTLVFLMKPHRRISWIFFLFGAIFGLLLTFLFKVGVPQPYWLGTIDISLYCFIPAIFIHLALTFPQERTLIRKRPYFQFFPYLISAISFVWIRSTTPEMLGIPKIWFMILSVYFLAAVLFFLGSCLQLRLSSKSEIVKIRSRMILLGVALAFSLPLLEMLLNAFSRVHMIPSFNYYLPFLVILPIAIGYSIIKHNLFDFDGFIKRTYGYILVTIGISGIYVIFLLLFNKVFDLFEMAGSPVFPLLFIVGVVFLFNPVRNRVQRVINRTFFRLEYDYQAILHKISETMRSLSSLDQIGKSMMDTALNNLFIDSGRIFLLNRERRVYECLTGTQSGNDSGGAEAATRSSMSTQIMPANDPLLEKMAEKKGEVTWYHIQEDPFYEPAKEACERSFKQLEATLLVPIIYEDNLTGFIVLGNKKSGKYYGREDRNLLKTLANQGAIAIENARLAEKMKIEEMVRANLARYLSPQVVDQVIKKDVQINLGGERKVATVLFSDIRDFTRISETLPPDQLVGLLNEYFTEMARVVFENQGSLDKFIGDAIVAVFGSLIPLENSAQTAVQTATQMMYRLSKLNEKWMAQYGLILHIGIGISTGEIFLGNIGSPERMEFTVMGDKVNMASRFSGVAHPGQILVTKDSLVHLGADIKTVELPPLEVKGKAEKQEVFEIIYA